MRLGGLHHITMITGDADRCVQFSAGVLGLRMVKQTVNFDAPDSYHLYFGDERGSAGSILTWFEFPGAPAGRPGSGMIHTLRLGVKTAAALEFWRERLGAAGCESEREADTLKFADYDGLRYVLERSAAHSALRAEHPAIPAEHAISDLLGARAYARDSRPSDALLTDTLGFADLGGGAFRLDGSHRTFAWAYDPPPAGRGRPGAGTVHHIAWAAEDADHLDWQSRVRAAGTAVTEVRDRDYFRSIYFREPRGILFEIATLSPGFAVDEDPDHLGETLRLPAMHEHLRDRLERTLTPLANPRRTPADE